MEEKNNAIWRENLFFFLFLRAVGFGLPLKQTKRAAVADVGVVGMAAASPTDDAKFCRQRAIIFFCSSSTHRAEEPLTEDVGLPNIFFFYFKKRGERNLFDFRMMYFPTRP
jgi:hypothetical protein